MVTTVAFNDDEQKLHEELFESKLTSRQFSKFVKDAFYDAVDRCRANNTEESQ